TFTIQPIEITVDRTVTLQGLDAQFNNINGVGYTVSDNEGNQFILIDTDTITAGIHTLQFRARQIGLVETTIGTITTPVTIIASFTTSYNCSATLEVGEAEETDSQLRTRRQKSVSIASFGYLDGLLGEVLNLPGVSEAAIYENVTNAVDS